MRPPGPSNGVDAALNETLQGYDDNGNLVRVRRTERHPEGRVAEQVFVTGWAEALADVSGVVLERYSYDAYGAPTFLDAMGNPLPDQTRSALGNNLLWGGGYRDNVTRTVSLGHRTYSERQGRFLSRDPLGLWGDVVGWGNGYAYVGGNSINSLDPMGLAGKTAEDWRRLALKNIGFSAVPGSINDKIRMNAAITKAYGDIARSNPEAFQWAGLARHASASVGVALTAGVQFAAASEVTSSVLGRKGTEGFTAGIAEMLAKGNFEVYNDLAWQHLAFAEGGLEELSKHQASIAPQVFKAWQDLAAAQGETDRKKRAGMLQGANVAMLDYEQRQVLQPLYGKYPNQTAWLGTFLASPFNSSNKFGEFPQAGGEAPNLGNASHRMNWFVNSIWPEWEARRDPCDK